MNYIFGMFCIVISPLILLFAGIKTLCKEVYNYIRRDDAN